MTSAQRTAFAGLCAGLGVCSCRQPVITSSPPAIEVEVMSGAKTTETFGQLLDGGFSFGSVPVLIPVQQTLTVTNLGTGLLNIEQISVSPDGGPFSLAGTLPVTVGGGASEPLTVQFDPTEQQSYGATLQIESDDVNQPMVGIPLTGIGSTEGLLCVTQNPAPSCTSCVNALDFGAVGQGQTVTKNLDLSSCGTADLDITKIELGDGGNPAFQIVSSNSIPDAGLLLAPDASIPFFDLSFSPTINTPASPAGYLVIQSSDPTHQPYIVDLTGQTVLAPIPIIGAPPTCAIGETITLDGGASYDPNHPQLLPITYQWSLASKPLSSSADLFPSITTPQTMLTCDVVGTYIVDLMVTNDAGVQSPTPAVASITAKPTDDLYVEMIWDNNPLEVDLHLLIDGGVYNGEGDCTAYNPDAGFGCIPSTDDLIGPGPDWAAIEVPPAADYQVDCVIYDTKNATSDSTIVTVRVYVYGVLAAQVCQKLDVVGQPWPAVTIAWPSGVVTPIGSSITCPESESD